jgi:hypothetical protein
MIIGTNNTQIGIWLLDYLDKWENIKIKVSERRRWLGTGVTCRIKNSSGIRLTSGKTAGLFTSPQSVTVPAFYGTRSLVAVFNGEQIQVKNEALR